MYDRERDLFAADAAKQADLRLFAENGLSILRGFDG